MDIAAANLAVPETHDLRTARAPDVTIVGLGTHAYTAWLLNRIDLHSADLPFDALLTDPGMIADIIEDDFALLLDPQAWRPVTDARGRVQYGHEIYSGPYRRPIVFGSLDPASDAGRAALQASIDRFRRLLAEPGRKLFVCVSGVDRCRRGSVQRLAAAIGKRTADAHLVVVRLFGQEPSLPAPVCEGALRDGAVSVYDMTPRTTMQAGLSFSDGRDNDRIADVIRFHAATTDRASAHAHDEGAEPLLHDALGQIERALARTEEQSAGIHGAMADQQAALRTVADTLHEGRQASVQGQERLSRIETGFARLEQQISELSHVVAAQFGAVRASAQASGQAQQDAVSRLEQERRAGSEALASLRADMTAHRRRIGLNLIVTILVGLAVAALAVAAVLAFVRH